jgi:hypothetical protein
VIVGLRANVIAVFCDAESMDMIRAAVANNADWCDLVCRLHGVPTVVTNGVWAALRRSPALYPDAVTLQPSRPPKEVLALVARGPGCSVKDSFADLDLAADGFEILFEARWIYHEPLPVVDEPPGWHVVQTADELHEWTSVHGATGVLGPELLDEPSVRVVAVRQGSRIVAGAIAYRSDAAVGMTNVFTSTPGSAAAWHDVTHAAAACYPDALLVGYEFGNALAAALSAGFVDAGPLRVWLRRD